MGPFDIGGLQVIQALQSLSTPRPQDPFGSMGSVNMQPEQPFNMQARMAELYQPQMIMQDRFNQHLNEMPQMQNPSMLRKIGAILYGMNQQDPFTASMRYSQAPYYQALEQWKQPLNSLQQAADNERLMNAQNRQWANQVVTQEMNQNKLDLATRKQEHLEADRARLRDRQDRIASLAEWKAYNNGDLVEDQSGKVWLVYPDGRRMDTGLDKLSDMEKLEIQNKAAMARVQVQQQGANQRNAATIAGANQRDANNPTPFNRVINNPDGTQSTEAVLIWPDGRVTPMPGGGTLQRPLSGAGNQYNVLTRPITTAQMTAKARQAISEHPEWEPYIKFTSSGQFERVEPFAGSGGLFGLGAKPPSDPAVIKQINDYIFGRNSNAGTTTGNPVPVNQQSNSPASAPVGMVIMIAPNGQEQAVPAERVAFYEARGARRK